jgi:hypothetical protein
MNTNNKTSAIDRKVLLSTLWIFVVLNMLYCDVVSLMDAGLLKQYLSGTVGGMKFTQGYLLGAGIWMAVLIAMVLLSRVLPYGANRWANIIAGVVATVVQFASLVMARPAMYYLFFSILEMAGTASLVWFALRWRNPASTTSN